MAEEVVDATAVPVGKTNVDPKDTGGNSPDPSPGAEADVKPDGSSASQDTPFDQDPKWKAARAAEKSLTGLLADKGFDSMDDLVAALDRGSTLEDGLSGRDLNEIIEKATTLEGYETQWAEQERQKLQDTETPEDTIVRLEREKKELENNFNAEKSKVTQAQEAEAAIETFNSEVITLVGKQDLPQEYHEFANLLLGADNPMLDVDPTNKQAFNQTASSMIDKVKAFEQAVLKRHKAGKIDPPATPPGEGGEEPAPDNTQKPIKTIKEAGRIALERLLAARKT